LCKILTFDKGIILPLLRAENISKSFGCVQALKGVSFSLERGEIRGLVGENGAGKSVFLKILGGVHQPDTGEIFWDGEKAEIKNPGDAQDYGYSIVHQESSVLPNRTIAQNIFLGREDMGVKKRMGLDKDDMRERAEDLLEKYFDLSLDAEKSVKELDVVEQKIVEAARALNVEAKVLVFDETTAQLSSEEKKRLFDLLNNLSNQGIGIIFVSHILEEVLECCDTVTVFRNGEEITTEKIEDLTIRKIINFMVGEEKGLSFPPISEPKEEIVLSVENLKSGDGLNGISFDLRKGESIGIMGIRGSGQRELLRTIFGIIPREGGEVKIRGERVKDDPSDAVRKGIVYLTDEREGEGIFSVRSILENLTVESLHLFNNMGVLKLQELGERAENISAEYRIRGMSSLADEASCLSGGNKQKMMLARLALSEPHVLLLSDPGKGVDVEAKEELYKLISKLMEDGTSVLLVSDDVEEITSLCHKVLIMRGGEVRHEMPALEDRSKEILEKIYQ